MLSRKTGYKIFDRYKEHGLEALTDRSRRPVRYANQLPPQIDGLIVSLKRDKAHWGARKIPELFVGAWPAMCASPLKASSTPFSTATAWSNASAGYAPPAARLGRRCLGAPRPMILGAAAGPLRRLRARVQCRKTASGARHEVSRRDLFGLNPPP
jgi:hypothetical protein